MKRLALALLLLCGCATPVQTLTRCPICGWPVELAGTEMHYTAKAKEVVTFYQCFDWACGYEAAVTNTYSR